MTSRKSHYNKVDELKEALEKRRAMGGIKARAETETEAKANAEDKVEAKAKAKAKDGVATKSKFEAEELAELTKNLRAAEEEAKSHYDKLLRVMAELDNFKKRSEREKQEMIRYGNERLVADLLIVLDDLERVLEHVPHGASKELTNFVDGVRLVRKHFVKVLSQYGLEEIKTEGEVFNPEYHEAVAHVPSDKVEADHIINAHRKGYMLNGRVIRAAMVEVSKGKE